MVVLYNIINTASNASLFVLLLLLGVAVVRKNQTKHLCWIVPFAVQYGLVTYTFIEVITGKSSWLVGFKHSFMPEFGILESPGSFVGMTLLMVVMAYVVKSPVSSGPGPRQVDTIWPPPPRRDDKNISGK